MQVLVQLFTLFITISNESNHKYVSGLFYENWKVRSSNSDKSWIDLTISVMKRLLLWCLLLIYPLLRHLKSRRISHPILIVVNNDEVFTSTCECVRSVRENSWNSNLCSWGHKYYDVDFHSLDNFHLLISESMTDEKL